MKSVGSWKRRYDDDSDFFLDGSIERELYAKQHLDYQLKLSFRPPVEEFTCREAHCNEQFDSLASFDEHQALRHQYACSKCQSNFISRYHLDIHFQEEHDRMFAIFSETQPMYECLVLGCKKKCKSAKGRRLHLRDAHLYPDDIPYEFALTNRKWPAPPSAEPEPKDDSMKENSKPPRKANKLKSPAKDHDHAMAGAGAGAAVDASGSTSSSTPSASAVDHGALRTSDSMEDDADVALLAARLAKMPASLSFGRSQRAQRGRR